ncbi:MAG: ABC transporter permease [Lachnospiraceae bacterium]|nr:ABC transporter permease [Lachnospiraceae bacterium]
MLKLACRYMRYYKSQTFAILASMILTSALLSGISSLMYSSQRSDLENSRTVYGDWHYEVRTKKELCEALRDQEEGFCLKQCGKIEVRTILKEPYPIYFLYADEAYMQMSHRDLIKGSYPRKANEIAADHYTLDNLGVSGDIGDSFSLDGKEYILSGIVKSEWASVSNEMKLFVGKDFIGEGNQSLFYLKFDENKKLYRQLEALQKKYRISGDAIEANDEVVRYLGGERPDSIYEIVKFAVTDERGNFTYIILKLQAEYNLAFNGMLFLLCLFSIFVISSIFQISISKRLSEYGMMQTLGISERRIGGTLMSELWLLFLIGYPVGCLLGNGILKVCYQKLDNVFINKTIGATGTMTVSDAADQVAAQSGAKAAEFYVAWGALWSGFLFLFFMLAVLGLLTVYSMRKQSLHRTMLGDTSFVKKRRKIYSTKNIRLAYTVVRKFMFSNKKKAIGILLSLSLGGCIFFCTTYMVENLKIHAEMSMKSDDGLGAEYQIFVKSNTLSDTISETVVDEIKGMSELSEVYATKYVLGELTIQESELKWDEYFDEQNKDNYFQERFGGTCVKKENGTYGIKYDVYGYDRELLEPLKEFVLEGEIVERDLEKGNQIIAVANKDGQGNYDFYGKHPGDTVLVRVPKNLNCSQEMLKFEDSKDQYIEKEFEIAAIVSRTLAKEEQYLNINGWKNAQSIIMTNRQMSKQYGIFNYHCIHISSDSEAERDVIGSQLLKKIRNVPKAILRDYTMAIQSQKNHLYQQQLFFSGIAAILLVISLFHITNSMNYSILFRRREYGIMRAMGITDIGFYRMIVGVGILYGVLADLFIVFIYNLVLREIMDYYMQHVVQFLHFTAKIPLEIVAMVLILNIMIAVLAVLIPARKIVKHHIINELGK